MLVVNVVDPLENVRKLTFELVNRVSLRDAIVRHGTGRTFTDSGPLLGTFVLGPNKHRTLGIAANVRQHKNTFGLREVRKIKHIRRLTVWKLRIVASRHLRITDNHNRTRRRKPLGQLRTARFKNAFGKAWST